jgi:hypothetical protein
MTQLARPSAQTLPAQGGAMATEHLVQLLTATLDAAPGVRAAGEAGLAQGALQPGFGLALATVSTATDVPVGVRQLAGLVLRKYVKVCPCAKCNQQGLRERQAGRPTCTPVAFPPQLSCISALTPCDATPLLRVPLRCRSTGKPGTPPRLVSWVPKPETTKKPPSGRCCPEAWLTRWRKRAPPAPWLSPPWLRWTGQRRGRS